MGLGEKKFCCVTTPRRMLPFLTDLGRRFGTLAARAFGLGVAGFGLRGVTMPGLPPRRLPAPKRALAFGVLAVALIPASRHVPAATPFAQADPRPGSARSGGTAGL